MRSQEAVQWLAYIGRTRNIVTDAVNGREDRLDRVPNMKVDGYFAKTGEVFEYLECFGMSVRVSPIDMNPLVTPVRHC
jgi:hypothetical protein